MLPAQTDLEEGLKQAFYLFLSESSLSMAVGESGKIHVQMEVVLDKGRVQNTKGAVYFERILRIGA